MTTYVTQFRSTDSAAKSIDGNVGSLVNVLDSTLVIHSVFSTTNDSTWTDNTTEARLNAGSTFPLFITPATGDRTYFGMQVPFTRLKFDLGTLGTSATYVWEYWNGSAWTTLTVTDGTTAFTGNGSVTWTAPGSWATTAVNSTTLYWVRVRFTGSAPATNPLVNSVSYLGWLIYYSGTNTRNYKQGGGAGLFLSVNDNGPNGTALGKEADVSGFETATGALTGTGQFPTTTQNATLLTWRKSTATGATTRTWVLVADDRTLYLFILTGDTAGKYYEGMFGDIYAMLSSDAYRVLIVGALNENTNGQRNFGSLLSSLTGLSTGHYMPRTYAATGTSIQVGKRGDYVLGGQGTSWSGTVPYPNGPDSAIYLAPVWVNESSGHQRGRLRGIYHFCHAVSNYTDLDTNAGTGTFAGKSFLFLKTGSDTASGYVLDLADDWETN